MIKEVTTASVDETRQLGERVAPALAPGDVLCLAGELGAGKTAFAAGIARGLYINQPVTSPTFNIIKEYAGGRLPLYHFDVYRLERPEQLFDLDYEEYFFGDGVTLIEWPEKILPLLPEENLWIELNRCESPDCRRVLFMPKGERYRRLLTEVNLP